MTKERPVDAKVKGKVKPSSCEKAFCEVEQSDNERYLKSPVKYGFPHEEELELFRAG